MKIVKEHINEIKRDENTSGLSSIGVGNTAMYKAFNLLKQHWPGVLWVLDKPKETNSPVLKKEFEESAKLFGVQQNMVRYISTVNTPSDRKKFLNMFMGMKNDPNIIEKNYKIKGDYALHEVKSYTSLEWGITIIESSYNSPHSYTEAEYLIFKMPEDINYKT